MDRGQGAMWNCSRDGHDFRESTAVDLWVCIRCGLHYEPKPADGGLLWDGEHCQICGCSYRLAWDVPDKVWQAISQGQFNLACIECFLKRAEDLGIIVSQQEIRICGGQLPESKPDESRLSNDNALPQYARDEGYGNAKLLGDRELEEIGYAEYLNGDLSPSDFLDTVKKAQDAQTREATLKEVGEWMEKHTGEWQGIPYINSPMIEALKKGEMPE